MNSSCMCNSLESLGRSLDVRPGPDSDTNVLYIVEEINLMDATFLFILK